MAGNRSTPPLFDLLRPGADRGGEVKPTPQPGPVSAASSGPTPTSQPRSTTSKPIIRLDTTPRPAAAPAAAPPKAESGPVATPRQAPATSRPRSGSRATVTLSVVWVWLLVAGGLASLLAVWGIAYSAGGAKAKERLARLMEPPETDGVPATSPKPNVPTKPVVTPDKGGAKPPAINPQAPANKPVPAGVPAADARQAGFNYLLCASLLDKAAAEAAAGFLTQNNVPATAVPTKGRTGKYSVYTLLGIPSESFNEQLKARNDHKAEVARLGQIWRRERPGSPDFSDALWDKYKP